MNLNITLVVQAINFVIAYHIITKILLKPAVKRIIQEKAEDKALEDRITAEVSQRDAYLAYKNERWQECQRYFKHHIPTLVRNNNYKNYQSFSILEPAFNDKELEKAAHMIAKDLKNKIINSKDNQ